MDYEILEASIEFKSNQIDKIVVLVDCTSSSSRPLNDVRAIAADTRPRNGYMYIRSAAELNAELLQKVASSGMELVARDEIFPGWKKKYLVRNS